ncbi:hypothetical protein [Cryobacterium sp. TMT2-15-1]|uniref:hypothetical protein n=1 Tax=Cryobacterium sp. TMT2-15-1 TaxID=1259246 RepID=UPI00141B944E|nr:hypothetical protein [Cryobacterium sp. TMT2-15-1]
MLFLISPYSAQANNLPGMVAFVVSATALFALGYHLSIRQSRRYRMDLGDAREITPLVRGVIVASALWFLLFSIASLEEYGARGLGDIVTAAMNPSASYYAKFNIYIEQQTSGRTSRPIQLAVLTGALYAVLVPVTIYYWRRIGVATRVLTVTAALSYVGYFVFIGTQKGIGDLLVMAIAALAASAIALEKGRPSKATTQTRRWLAVVVIVLSVGFVGYLANNQGDRVEGTSVAGQFVPNPLMTSLFGEKFSRGLAVAMFYPTNGYIGLSKNLGVPFVSAGGLGGAPALGSYKTQYLGGENPSERSYPKRTEAATGWPAGQYWATVYPWLASDLTFPGAALFMTIAGWFMARMWLGARIERDPLSLVLFSQMAIFIAYVPANNQLMSARYTAIGFITLLGIYVVRRLVGGKLHSGKSEIRLGQVH